MKKIIALTIMFLCIIIRVFSQGEFGRVTPQTADFMRYGETSASLNTGSFTYEVPVFTIKTVDFSMPVSLCYTSDGFKPNKRPSCVGNNWFLNAGGSITREIYLAPDDALRTKQSDVTNFDLAGFNVCRKSGMNHSKESLYNLFTPPFQSVYSTLYIAYNGYSEDTMPDLFSFNMCGHSGSFVIGNDGNVVVSDKGYKVDISGMTNQPYEDNTAYPSLPLHSQITITAPDGTVFTFGNTTDLSAIEFSRAFDNQYDTEGGGILFFGPATINGWHLTKITTPHGTEVNFNYYNPDLSGFTPYNSNNVSSSIWQTTMTETKIPETTGSKKSYSETKSVYLESIVVNDGTEMDFSKSREKYNFYPTSGTCGILTSATAYDRPMFQLDTILLKYKGKVVHQYELNYKKKLRKSNGAGLRFLSNVNIDNIYSYYFSYDHPEDHKYPDPVFGSTTTDGDGYVSNYTYGVLSKIYYPTGGYTSLKFEKHDFGKRVDMYSSDGTHILNHYLNSNLPQNNIGGLRIRRLENHDADNNLLSFKEYYYISDMQKPTANSVGATTKSGIYLHYPPYYIDNLHGEVLIGSSSNLFSKNYNISEPNIAYSHVLEYSGDEVGYKRYSFTDYEDYPDIDDRYVSTSSIGDPLALAGINKLSSSSRKRGLLKGIEYLNNNGDSFGYEKYTHNATQGIQPADPNAPDVFSDGVIGVYPLTGGAVAMKIKIDKLLLRNKEIKTGNNSPIETTSYEYNDYNLLHTETFKNSDNKETVITTEYACDKTGGVYVEMNRLNLMSYPIEIITQKNGYEIERHKNDYKDNGKDIAKKYTSLGGNALREIVSYDLYDDRGRLLQSTDKSGIVSSYVWRDDLLPTPIEEQQTIHYPVAEIVNATYSTVSQKIDEFMLVGATLGSYINYANIDILREKIPEALITTYTYKPLVGITSMTDPRGVTTYYDYDDFNRLIESYIIENGAKKVLKKYDYHYKEQL